MQTTTVQSVPCRRPCRPLQYDEELLAVYAKTGSREAFEKLVLLYQREIYTYLYYFLRDAQLAEDACQATFLQLHLKCRQFEPGRRLRPWLYAIARNQAIDLGRRSRRRKTEVCVPRPRVASRRTTADRWARCWESRTPPHCRLGGDGRPEGPGWPSTNFPTGSNRCSY